MTYVLKSVFLHLFPLLAGAAAFWGMAWLVGLVFPGATFWVFCAFLACWAWIGWRYASLKDEVRQREGSAIRQSDIWDD